LESDDPFKKQIYLYNFSDVPCNIYESWNQFALNKRNPLVVIKIDIIQVDQSSGQTLRNIIIDGPRPKMKIIVSTKFILQNTLKYMQLDLKQIIHIENLNSSLLNLPHKA
jgi:hypothetical protein